MRKINPATFLPAEAGEPSHNSEEITDQVYASRPDLKDQPLAQADLNLYTDGSSTTTEKGVWIAPYAVTMKDQVLEAEPLPSGWSAQRAELYALIRALELIKGKRVNIIYTLTPSMPLPPSTYMEPYIEKGDY